MCAWVGVGLAPIHGAADGLAAVIVDHQVLMLAGAMEPVLDAILGSGDGRADDVLGRLAIGVGGCAGDVGLAFQALAQVFFGLAYVFAEDVSACLFVLAQVARWTVEQRVA